jgi:acetyltransferase-like isoleucine patch superfamily enzyme
MFRIYKTNINYPNEYKVFPKLSGSFKIGKNTILNNEAEVRCWRKFSQVEIGKYCSIGKCYFIIDGNHNPYYASTYPFKELGICNKAPDNKLDKSIPIVENDVWICDDAYIHAGVKISNGAVIASNTIVTKDVPPYAIVAGNPGKIIKYRFNKITINKLLKYEWWNYSENFIKHELAPYIDNIDIFLLKCEKYYLNKL